MSEMIPELIQQWPLLLAALIGSALLAMLMRALLVTPKGDEDEEPADRAPIRDSADTRQGVFGWLTGGLASQVPESKKETRDFNTLLRQAGIYSPTARISIYALRFVLLFVPLIVAGIIAVFESPEYTMRILLIGGGVAGALSIIPRLYVFFRRRDRIAQIRHGLADMMDMLSMCLGGGMPVGESLQHVSRNLERSYPALAEELQILRKQAEVGSLKLALDDFAERIDTPEARQVASLLIRGEQLGTRLSVSLLDQADHFRKARRQLATMQANRTPVILSLPLMFCFAPAVLILLMSPALMELNEFLNPQTGQSILANNQQLQTGGERSSGLGSFPNLADTINNLTPDLTPED